MDQELLKNKQGLTEEEYLAGYDANRFQRPSLTVDMLIFTVIDREEENYRKLPEKTLKLLLVKRGEHPFIGQWALPGGFVAVNESLDAAALRELRTETNISNIYMEQLYTWGEVDRDPRTRVVSCSYMSLIDSKALQIKAGDDAAEAMWFEIKYQVLEEKKTALTGGYSMERIIQIQLDNGREHLSARIKVTENFEGKVYKVSREVIESRGIAFDHGKMIAYAMERLRNKINYTDIAFQLMPELFTLTELQKVYEVILDKELLAAAFRRKVADMVIETDYFTKDAGHRPSKLYRFNPAWKSMKEMASSAIL